MTASGGGALYTPELLSLAVSLADWPLEEAHSLRGEARSRSCGSTLVFGTEPADGRRVGRLGMRVSACAVGQAAAAIFARHAEGLSAQEIDRSEAELEAWLAGNAGLPSWPDIAKLEGARAYPGRHGAILLPWKAARDALCKAGTER